MNIKHILFTGAAAAIAGMHILGCGQQDEPPPEPVIAHHAYLMEVTYYGHSGRMLEVCDAADRAAEVADNIDKAAVYAVAAYNAAEAAFSCGYHLGTAATQASIFHGYLTALPDDPNLVGPWVRVEKTRAEYTEMIKGNEDLFREQQSFYETEAETYREDADINWMKAFGELYPGYSS